MSFIAAAILIWASLGFAAWYIHIKRIGHWGAYDALMLGLCILVGPFTLITVLEPPRS